MLFIGKVAVRFLKRNSLKSFEIRLGQAVLDLSSGHLRDRSGRDLPLRYRSRQVLRLLARHRGEIVTRRALVEAAWDVTCVSDASVAQCIADIRKAIADTEKRIVETVPRQGYRLAAPVVARAETAAIAPPDFTSRRECKAPASDAGPVIAVLPFDDLGISGVPATTLVATLSEAIITDLARYPELTVISRNDELQGPPVRSLAGIARRFRADYLVTGSLRSNGATARVSAQLVAARNLSCVWVDEVDLNLDECIDLSRWIGRHVANVVGAKVIDMAETRIGLGEFSAMLVENAARSRMLRFRSQDAFRLNISEQEVALQRYPHAAWGNFGQALALRVGIDAGWIVQGLDAARSRAESLAARALAIAPENYLAHYAVGRTLAGRGEIVPAVKAFERAVSLNPSSTLVVSGLIDPCLNLGDTARALELVAMAERMNPLRTRELSQKKARTYWQMGEPEHALRTLENIPGRTPEQGKRCCHVNLSAIGEGIALVGSGDVRSRFPDIKCLQPMEADG
ncbi:winged helix-turn-helix domain-containing protein [Rhodobacteraceae bacterium F11138]|nr:winged helix-turn-helix domain-containing protein [Rhodobacteraceae bacterium F11138]